MAKQIVTKAEGEAYRIEADGSKIKLRVGDLIDDGARIITETGASVRFEDEKGVPLEIGENTGTILFSDAGPELSGTLLAAAPQDAPAKETDAPTPNDAEAQNPLPSDSEGEDDSEAHSFVELPRIKYGSDINLQYARDVNVTSQIEGRASLNPRIKYSYNLSIDQEIQSYKDTRFPFDGGGRGGEESHFEPVRPAAETIPMPETTGTAAVTDEDVPIVIDPLENFVIPSGMQLTITDASAQYGAVQIIDGKITYQPNADYHGDDKITVTVTDQTGRTYESEVDVTVSPVVDTVDDNDSVAEHASVDTDVLANDKFADLPGAKVTEVTQGQYGEVTINKDGTVKYTPKTDWLAEGEKLTDTYQYTVTTAAGNTETATVTITITGTNDAPLLTDDVRYVTEDAPDTNTELPHGSSFDDDNTSKVTGNILDNDSDPDQNDTLTVTKIEFSDGTTVNAGETITGKYGSLKVNGDGTYTYTLNSGTDGDEDNDVQQLMANETAKDEFTVSVTDGHTTKTETVTIHITGTNDAPEITKGAGDSDGHDFTGGDTISQDGTLTVTDIDVKDTVSTVKEDSLTIGGDYDESSLPGGLTVADLKNMLTVTNGSIDGSATDGKIDWHFNAGGDSKFDFLADGEKLTLTYTVKSTDGSGAEATHDITITITGTNDAPVISLGDGDSEEGGVRETDSGSLTAGDTLTVTDADISDTVSTTVTGVKVSGSGDIAGHIPSEQELLGMFTAETSGLTNTTTVGKINWTFNTGNKTFDYLAVGEEVKLTYTVTVDDGHGGTIAQDVVVTVTGSNDRPEISVVSANGDSDSISFNENDANTADGSAVGTLTLTDVDVSDEVGVTVDKVEIDGSSTYNGDLPPGLEATLKDMLSVDAGNILSNTDTNKQFDWKFDSGDGHEFNFLAEGETLTLKYTVKADDNNGIASDTSDPYNEGSTDTHEITVTITGTNDAPAISFGAGDTANGSVTETDAPHLTVSNTLTVTDADISDTVNTSVTLKSVGGNGNITGNIPSNDELLKMFTAETSGLTGTTTEGKINWAFNTGKETFDYLSVGETVELTYTVTVDDGHGGTTTQDVVVTVHGSNDTPEISVGTGDSTGKELTENGAGLTDSGTLTLTDLDLTDKVGSFVTKVEVEGSGAGLQGQPSLDDLLKMLSTGGNELDGSHTDGKINWTFDSNGTSFDYLGEGDELVLRYTVQAKDDNNITNPATGEISASNEQVITITIKGTNSAPVLTNDTNSVTEDNNQPDGSQSDVTTTGDLFENDSDPDHDGKDNWKITNAKESISGSDTAVSAEGTDIAGKYGTLHLKSDGTYTYTLNNNSDEIQQLGHDGKLEEIFTVTVKDGDLPEQTQNLTITINGTNDRPVISVPTGETVDRTLSETAPTIGNTSVDAFGKLTLTDVDTTDNVNVSIKGVNLSGDTTGLISTTDEILKMLKLQNASLNGSESEKEFTWEFDSGTEAFNYLKDGETLTLTYTVQAADNSGKSNNTSNEQTITINITGSTNTGSPKNDAGVVEEHGTLNVSAHTDITATENNNLLFNDGGDGKITSFKIAGDTTEYKPGTDVEIKVNGETIGVINIAVNGNYTFTPQGHFSGKIPTITYTTDSTDTSKNSAALDITVTPVADAPTWTAPAPSGSEDAKIPLGLKLPTITDNTDLNGAAAGDHPERLGYITISGIPNGAVIFKGGTELKTSTDGTIKIVIVDGDGNALESLHYSGISTTADDVRTMTSDEFNKLTIKPPANSGVNITGLKLSVTSYETNDDGVPLKNGDGSYISATSSANVAVDVLAVTDATPDVKLGGSNSTPTETQLQTAIANHHITITDTQGTATGTISAKTEGGSGAIVIEEDCTMKIDAEYLKASVSSTDTDGSEKYVVTVSGLAAGSVVNGVTAGADGTVTLTAETSVKSGSIDIFTSGLTITPPENFSGKMDGVTIKVETYDTDGDSSGTIAHNTAEMTLPVLVVTPVVDGVDTLAVKQAVGKEDEPIALHIKPSCSDGSETFNVKIDDIPDGAKITYGGTEYTVSGNSVTISGFDSTKPLTVTPPPDSNKDFKLKVTAQTVESDNATSAWSTNVELAVTVHSVADPVTVYDTTDKPLTYTETQAEANGIKLGKLIVKADDNKDGSEQVTLTVTNLAPEFTLAGSAVEFKGGEGTGRTWLVTMKQGVDLENTDAYIKTPANFSGKIEFSAQATNTDSTQAGTGTPDSNTSFSQVTNVAITVTPTPEATVNLSGAANEDELQQLSFAIQYQNGDTDETLNAVYIKASDADGIGKNFTIVYSTDGEASISLKDAVSDAGNGVTKETIDGIEYYKIVSADGKGINNIFVQGDAQYSGKGEDNSFDIKYEVNDSHYGDKDTATGEVTETTITDGTYHVTFKPVTDPTTMEAVAAGDINVGDSGAITLSGTTVTVGTGSANSFSVDVTVNASADVDGSEHFIKLIVDGVPDGVSVNGATYLGDSGAVEGTGRWLLTVDKGKIFNSENPSFTTTLDFTVDRGNPNIWGLHGEDAVKVTVTAVSQDEMGSMKGGEAESSTGAEFGIKIGFDGTDPAHADIPAPGINITEGAGTEEDSGECTLGDFFKAEYQIDHGESQGQTEYRFSFEINGLPKDTIVSGDAVKGGSVTITAGGGVTVSGFGNQAAMQSVLDNVKVTLPPNYNNNSNSNTADGMNLDVTWKTDGWDLNGGDAPAPATDTINVTPNVTPITDPMEITIVPASGTINENQPGETGTFKFTVSVDAGNDGDYGNVRHEGRLFLKLDGARESDTITYGGKTYTLADVADGEYSGITAGKYYVIDGVSAGDRLTLAYQPADYYSGNIKVTATIVSQETGAANEIAASGNSELTVNPVNSEYKFTVADAADNENGTAGLTIKQTGSYDADGSEKIHSVVLSGVDAAHSDDFIVKYTVDGAEKAAAKVAAGMDADGKPLYEWVLSTDSAGKLPAGIKITGLNHYSGTQDLKLTVVTGETALGTGKENSYDFSLTFHPTADGFSDFTPTLTFGKAGEYIDLNLNAMVNDTSDTVSETATVTLSGLGDGASFFIARDTNGDGTADSYVSVTTAYEGGKYTLSGIALDEINDIKILSPNVGKTNVTVDAWTVEPDAQSGYGQSKPISEDTGHFGNKFDITVSASAPTSGEDRLIYGGAAGTYDGGAGTDTLYLANFRETANSAKNDIDFEAAATIKNIEIIDMSDGAHSLTKVTADAVKNMTDAGNKLLIKGGDDDTIALSDGWVKGEDTSGWRTYTNDGATINVDGDVNVTINGIASMSLMMAMAFAPLAAAAEPAIMPDSLAGCDFSSDFGAAAVSGSPAFSLTAEGMIDFSSLTHSSFGTLDMENASAQSLYHVDPYGVYGVTDGSHELTVTGTELDSVSLADSAEAAWGAPELSADGSHYSYTATGDFDHDAATPDDTVTLNVSRAIYDDTLAYDAHAMNDGGLGDDTLTFGHEDSTVDFSGGAASHIANIERFDLGEGDHSLENITAKDVFNMTDARGTLTINGDNADHVTLSDVLDDATDGMWESSPFQSVESGVSYSVYTGSFEGHMVTLKIEDEIIQQLTTHTKG